MATNAEYIGNIPHAHPTIQEAALEYGVHRLALTEEGAQLAEEHPETLHSFLQATRAFTRREINTEIYPFIGKGRISHVHGISDAPDVCIKASDSTTQGNRSYYTGMSSTPTATPSLSAEARLMNSLGKNLAKRDQGVHAPKIYAVAKTLRTQTMLQERVSRDFIPLKAAIEELTPEMYANIISYESTLRKRIACAIGASPLKLGIGDLAVGARLNSGNVLINDSANPETTDIYVVDLMGPNFSRAVAARIFGSMR